MKLKHHLHLVTILRMCGAVTPLTYAFIISRYFPQTTIVFVTFLITGVLIDVSEKMKYNDFQITAEDIIAWEKEHCAIPRGSVFVIRFGWSSVHCDNSTAYFVFVNRSSYEMQFPVKARENFTTAKFISTNETILVEFKCR